MQKVNTIMRLNVKTHKALKATAKAVGVPMSTLVDQVLTDQLPKIRDEHKAKEKALA